MNDKLSVGSRLKDIRIQLCMSQKDFGVFLGVHKGAISLYELGLRQPGFGTIKRMIPKLKEKGIDIKPAELRNH